MGGGQHGWVRGMWSTLVHNIGREGSGCSLPEEALKFGVVRLLVPRANLARVCAADTRARLCLPFCAGLIAVIVPTVAGIWAYNEGYLTPQ